MAKGDPLTPREYAHQYLLWRRDRELFDEIGSCICGTCIICNVLRPALLAGQFDAPEPFDDDYEEDDYETDE